MKFKFPAHILSALFLAAFCDSVCADGKTQYYFSHYRSADGLPINTVTCAAADRFGYLWFGTRDGICRFDGDEFEIFESPDVNGIMNGIAFTLGTDSDGLLWFCTTKGVGNYNLFTGETVQVKGLSGVRVSEIVSDRNGDVWMASSGSAVHYEKSSGEYTYIPQTETGEVLHLCTDRKGDVWFTASDGFLTRYDCGKKLMERVMPGRNSSPDGEHPVFITAADERFLLLSSSKNRLYRFDTVTSELSFLTETGHTVNCLSARTPTEFWAGTSEGLFIYDSLTDESSFIDESYNSGLTNNNITCLLKDKEGNVWMGSYYGGLNMWSHSGTSISQIFQTDRDGSFYGHLTHAFTPCGEHGLLAGTEDGFLNLLDFDDRSSRCLSDAPGFPKGLNIHSLLTESDTLWIITYNRGIFLYNLRTGIISPHRGSPSVQCVCALKTADGDILVGARNGLFRLDRQKDRFLPVESIGSDKFIHTIYQDSRGTIWTGTFGTGLYCSTDDMKTFEKFGNDHIEGAPALRYITHITEDRNGHLWIATDGEGVCRINLNGAPEPVILSRQDGLPSNIVTSITEDDSGTIWLATTKGLVRTDPKTLSITKGFQDTQNQVGDQFVNGACHRFPDGRLCFGTTKGMITFNPNTVNDPISSVSLYFRRITSENGQTKNILTEEGKSVTLTERISVREKDAAHLSISFSAPYFSNLTSPRYEYTLAKGNKVFTHNVTENGTVTFTDLPSGHYRLKVKVLGSSSADASKELSITIIHPLYRSAGARVLYILMVISFIASMVVLLLRRKDAKEKQELDRMETVKQKEIYDAKINFFTNITHEIRTPLSLIKMPIEKILREKDYTENSREDILTIKSNTDRLLELINQLLDMRKMEQNRITVQYMEEDICSIVRNTSGYFAKAAAQQHISYTLSLPEEPIRMMCSADFVKKIVGNLLSNAVKYCSSTIEVSLTASQDGSSVQIRVTSDGDLITGDDRERIFKPFYQVKTVGTQLKGSNGTGLGLPYARTLANLHKGSLLIDTSVTDRNSFVLTLPLLKAIPTEENSDTAEAAQPQENEDSSKRTLLVVEDAEPMKNYLAKELSGAYNILTASNGEEALNIIKEKKVDLVVSDIMMPVMDGCQLCNHIKSEVEFSHIPIILLTAVVGVETRIETLESGADGYIEKPFEMELLKANISNLFRNREIAYRQFSNSPLSHYHSTTTNKVESAFMEKLHTTVMKHLADQNLGIEVLTDLLGTSKTTLYRKIKANTGLNTNEYIRLCRLKKAADMLASQEYRINEVAYLTGFSSPSYFATSFQKQFNISPSAFVKNLRG